MAPKKRKQPAETYPLRLTASERKSLLGTTRLRPGLKKKIKQVAGGTPVVELTRKELDEMAEEVDTSLAFVPEPDKKRLNAVFDKIDELLDAVQDEPDGAASPPPHKAGVVYQFKVTLKDSQPPIWRRIQVPDCTLGELHEVLQVAMGWEDAHLHQFVVRGDYYGPRPPDDLAVGMETADEDQVRLSQIAAMGRKMRFRYDYDFGDSWQHEIVLEQTLKPEPHVNYPRCIDGARACPPEDIGGVWGYAEFLEVMADPSHSNYREMKEWCGGNFDPETFSVEAVNQQMKQLARRSNP
jgi:hypothetical protein